MIIALKSHPVVNGIEVLFVLLQYYKSVMDFNLWNNPGSTIDRSDIRLLDEQWFKGIITALCGAILMWVNGSMGPPVILLTTHYHPKTRLH